MLHLILQPEDTSHPFLKHPMSAPGETIENRPRKTKQQAVKLEGAQFIWLRAK